jgi:hypothetical protein
MHYILDISTEPLVLWYSNISFAVSIILEYCVLCSSSSDTAYLFSPTKLELFNSPIKYSTFQQGRSCVRLSVLDCTFQALINFYV